MRALLQPLQGANKVARCLIALGRSRLIPNYDLKLAMVNGQVGILYYLEGKIHNVVTFKYIKGHISAIYFVRNPDKLQQVEIS